MDELCTSDVADEAAFVDEAVEYEAEDLGDEADESLAADLGDEAGESVAADLGDEAGDSAGEAAEDLAPPALLVDGADLPVGGGRIHESPKT
jgi:hypothetical protein